MVAVVKMAQKLSHVAPIAVAFTEVPLSEAVSQVGLFSASLSSEGWQ
jgi:hypothetical protein